MSKSALIQYALIIIGIFAAYTGVQLLLGNFLLYLLSYLSNPYADQYLSGILITLLSSVCYCTVAFFLIVRSKIWADKIVSKSGAEGGLKITAKPNQLLYVLLIVIAVYELMQQSPKLILLLYNGFVQKVSVTDATSGKSGSHEWIITLAGLLFPFILIAIADKLAVFLAEKIRPAEEDTFIVEETETP